MTPVNAQTTLTIYYGDPTASPDAAFDGNVFQVGNQVGDAPFYVKFGGSGTRYFEIDSPGENNTKKVNGDGFVIIRPITSMVIDQSKIKNFSGTVSGSVVITVKPLSITTINTSSTDILPGTEITATYRTGAGTFPVDLAINSFKVQLLSADGSTVVGDLLNSADQYSGREQKGSSFGGIRSIKATIPGNTSPGTYRVRVVTQGLIENVIGSASPAFVVRSNTVDGPAISTSSLSGSYCAGSVVSFPFSATGSFPAGNGFKVQLINTDESLLQELSGTSLSTPINATLPASLATGTYRFRIVATAASVQSNTGTISIAALPTLTISGSATTTAGSTALVQLSFTGTPPWSFTYVDNNIIRSATASVSPTTITPTFSTATVFDNSFIKSFRDSGCGTSDNIGGSAQISIRQSQVILTTSVLSSTYCPGTTLPISFTASSSLPSIIVYEVQLSDAAGSFVNAQVIGSGTTSPVTATLPTSLTARSGYRVQVVIQRPTSPGSTDYSVLASSVSTPLDITRPGAPTVADVSFCPTTVTSPLSATGMNLKWYNANGQVLASAPTPPASQASTYYVTQTVNGCESLRATINVTPTSIPTAPVVNSVSLCQGGQSQLPTGIPNALWYSSAIGGTGSPQPPAVNSQAAGEQFLYVSQTINGCESPRTAVKAVVYPIPVIPTVPTPTTICQNSMAAPLTAAGSSLTWYNQSGSKLSVAPVPNTSTTGIQYYSVSQTVNGCESMQSTVSVFISPAPPAPVAGSARFCVNQTPSSLTAIGTNLRWYAADGTALTGSPTFSTSGATTYTFYVTQTDANGCESLRQPVSVSVAAAPSAPTATSVALCQGGQGQFSVSIPNALWYSSATGGTGSSQPPALNSQTAGEQIVYVSQTVNGCESSRTAVKAVVNSIPVAPTVPASVSICQYAVATALTASGASLTWYNSSGSKLGAAPTPATLTTDTQSYSVSQTVNGCESMRAAITVAIRPAPKLPIANSVRYCVGEVAQPLSVTGLNVKWYTEQTGGTASPNSPGFFTIDSRTYTFYVTQTDVNTCESLRQPVSVSVVAPPSAPSVKANQIFCQLAQADTLTATPRVGLIWEGPGISSSANAPVPVTSQPGTFTYLVAQKAGSCISPKAQITVRVVPTPLAPNVTSTALYCVGAASTPLSATGTNLTWYTNTDHSGQSFEQIIPNTQQAGITVYYVTQKDANNCQSPNSSVEVRVSNRAIATLSGDGSVYPGDSTAIRIRLSGDGPWTFIDWNNRSITASDSLYVIWVRPAQTRSYAITNLQSTCGPGDSGTPYLLSVLSPLATLAPVEPVSINVYPNPTNGDVSVDWSSSTKQSVTFQIINAAGIVVRQVRHQSSSTPQTEHFQLGTQPAGMYFLKVQTDTNGVNAKPIIKQ
ncbi:Ig-like domain-containing protein [Spirosoma fluminis]